MEVGPSLLKFPSLLLMNYIIKKNDYSGIGTEFSLASILMLILIAGCSDGNKNLAVIDTSFIEANRGSPTFEQWEHCSDELLFLVSKKNKAAIEFALRVIPIVEDVDQVTDIDTLELRLYENIDLDEI